ncbi:uncharacterized protein [Venturia canescens]|uniref:uncharacterized protein isoform X1 n=1 Tax=Venturia canescens TaxID=32260 RepID=UPI001C9C9407|nr:uncharacterized protein LOC122416031 isoform X1 [Venturia canescens]
MAVFRKELFKKSQSEPGTLKKLYDEGAKTNQIAAQLLGFPKMKEVMHKWRKQCQISVVPKNISEIAAILESDVWEKELRYEMIEIDAESGAVTQTKHHFQPYAIKNVRAEIAVIESHVVFGWPTFAAVLKEASVGFIDGTFNVVPNVSGAIQLLNVMVEYGGQHFPIAFALLSRKTEEAYVAVLRCVMQFLIPSFKPKIIITDFEAALENAVKTVFPQAELLGCRFHHSQALIKRFHSRSVISRVKRECPHLMEEAYTFERNLMDLCLLPAEFIPEGFRLIDERIESEYPELALIFTDAREYYARFWIKGKGPKSFSHYKKSVRTNNPLERWHRKFKEAAATRPQFDKFMKVLKNLVQSAHLDYLTVVQGVRPHRKRSLMTECRENLLVQAWEEMGNLSTYNLEERKQRMERFLEAVSSFRSRTAELANKVSVSFVRWSIVVVYIMPSFEITKCR